MNRPLTDKPELAALYYLFIAFIGASMVGMDGNAAFYAGLLPFLLACGFMLVLRVGTRQSINLRFLLLCLILAPLLFCGVLEKYSLYMRLLVLEFLLLFFLFSEYRISLGAFTRCLNLSYVLFFSLSLLDWLGMLPLVPHDSKNSFYISIAGRTIETLYGLGGSTADIDSYSGLVLMWNLFVNRGGRYRLVMIALSGLAMLMTFRLTPVVAFLAACLTYLFVWNRLLAMLALILPAMGFVAVLVILQVNPVAQVPLTDTDWYSLLWKATHARSSIWVGQIDYYLTQFRFADFFFGPLDERMTVPFIDGEGRFHKDSYNPHNTYLALLFRSTAVFVVLYTLFLWGALRRVRRNTFPVIFFISIVSYTNAGIIGLQNPAYLLVTMYLLMAVPRAPFRVRYGLPRRFESSTGPAVAPSSSQGQATC